MAYILQLFPVEMLGLTPSGALIIGFIFHITLSSPLQYKKILRMIKHGDFTVQLKLKKDISVTCYRNNAKT